MNRTREEAAKRYPRLGQLIAGEMRYESTQASMNVIDPTTGSILGAMPMATEADVDEALVAASKGFDIWRNTSAFERSKLMRRVADRMRERADALAELLVLELGKPWSEALGEVEVAAGMWEWAAEEGRRAYGRVIPSRELNARQMALVEPVGPVAAFVTWNGPLVTPSRKMSGAIGAGCSILLRASEEVPACAFALGQIVYECGFPAGVLSVLAGDPVMMSTKLLESPVTRAITFTGSTAIGKLLSQQAVTHMKRPIMELGGHGPVLAFEGIDVRTFAKRAVAAKFANSGQVCFAPTRFYVQRSIYADVVDAMTAEAKQIIVGCGFDSSTQMGPLKSERRLKAIEDLIADAKQRELRVTTGGKRIERPGFFYEPTIVADATIEAKLSNAEPFGPIAALTPFDTYDEAIALANRLPYGLGAYVHAREFETLHRAVNDLEAGNVICNGWRVTYPETPFGGHKESGMYSEGGIEGLRAFQNVKYASFS
ncbi:succinate semialdehyde dehydrogenase [Caballeronia turbans]|jgi:succinate-semialdehyde dehydrogenase/glutarate-semialdehyde dehydrogenase|uniref:NAD-dependent succinate-semialdehyde dehydrogenase n=1 Tax=Caballeronia sp. INML2 TaxID=2921748 RepID=UPI00074BF7D0|nr:NAD-dependent succinate-semialdehyde dehydrogenase [Caballeronia sp. INML2]SAL55233.1 succinate semialdehyde dehydrogenase [Caballeronia turbans]